jgi:hypothetical protein
MGTAIGAAGTYFAEKYTDERRKNEQRREEDQNFAYLVSRMPDLLGEMREDLAEKTHAEWREFFIVRKGTNFNTSPNSFFYEEDEANGFLSKTRTLEEYGLVSDITPGKLPKFRMSDMLVQRLLQWRKEA